MKLAVRDVDYGSLSGPLGYLTMPPPLDSAPFLGQTTVRFPEEASTVAANAAPDAEHVNDDMRTDSGDDNSGDNDSVDDDKEIVDAFLDDASVFYARTAGFDSSEEANIHINECLATEVLSQKDPRRDNFGPAIKLELEGQKEKAVFETVNVSPTEREALNVLHSRFVLAYKNPGTKDEMTKARLVVQALPHLDRDKPSLFAFSPTVSKASLRLMLLIPASMEFSLYLRDLSQAFVCSEYELLHDAYLVPPLELGIPIGTL